MELEEMIFNKCLKYWRQISVEYSTMIKRIEKKVKVDTLTGDSIKIEVSHKDNDYYVDVLLYNNHSTKKIKHIANKEEVMLITDSKNKTIELRGKKLSKLKYFETIVVGNNNSYINNEDKIFENICQGELLLALDCYLKYQNNFKILMETKCNDHTFEQMYKNKIKKEQEYIELLYKIEENIDILPIVTVELIKEKHSK